jgi:hypothetical protein
MLNVVRLSAGILHCILQCHCGDCHHVESCGVIKMHNEISNLPILTFKGKSEL